MDMGGRRVPHRPKSKLTDGRPCPRGHLTYPRQCLLPTNHLTSSVPWEGEMMAKEDIKTLNGVLGDLIEIDGEKKTVARITATFQECSQTSTRS